MAIYDLKGTTWRLKTNTKSFYYPTENIMLSNINGTFYANATEKEALPLIQYPMTDITLGITGGQFQYTGENGDIAHLSFSNLSYYEDGEYLFYLNGYGHNSKKMDAQNYALLRTISFIDGEDTTNAELIKWVTTNCTLIDVQLTKVDNTEWDFNNALWFSMFASEFNYYVNFKSNNNEYSSLHSTHSFNGQQNYWTLFYGNTLVYSELSGWLDSKFQKVLFTDGADSSNPDLMNWLWDNANLKIVPKKFTRLYRRNVILNIANRILAEYVKKPNYEYISLGDSIAAAQNINSDWEDDYGIGSQYGENGNTETRIVTNSYTDRIRQNLIATYGRDGVTVKSFAHSGDNTEDLRDDLEHNEVSAVIQNADIVTVCIGANTILTPALSKITDFISYGNPALTELEADLENGFALLQADANTYGSYRNIFKKLAEINTNPNTKFAFTNIYNPYKYLWVDPSYDSNDYTTGYFSPILTIPEDIEIDNPITGNEIVNVRKFVYETEISGMSMKKISERINDPSGNGQYSLAQWIEQKINRLNEILAKSIDDFGDNRFRVVDTKSLFETIPDNHIQATKNYSDLVNVEIVRGETVADLNWGKLWDNWDVDSLSSIVSDILETIRTNVLVPDLDPHPETYGHYLLERSFEDGLGLKPLKRYTITFDANGGIGTMPIQTIISTGDFPAYTTLNLNSYSGIADGYYFMGWKDSNGNNYSDGQMISINENITLYAQWESKLCAIALTGTGKRSYATATINGTVYRTGQSDPISVPIGTVIKLSVKKSDEDVKYDAEIKLYKNNVYHSTLYSGEQGTYDYIVSDNIALMFGYDESRVEMSGYNKTEYAGWINIYE